MCFWKMGMVCVGKNLVWLCIRVVVMTGVMWVVRFGTVGEVFLVWLCIRGVMDRGVVVAVVI